MKEVDADLFTVAFGSEEHALLLQEKAILDLFFAGEVAQ